MTITVEAVYENGVFKPKQPLHLDEGTEVQIIIKQPEHVENPLEHVIGIGDSGRTDGAAQHDRYIYGKIRP